jgi:hypothetical protein
MVKENGQRKKLVLQANEGSMFSHKPGKNQRKCRCKSINHSKKSFHI